MGGLVRQEVDRPEALLPADGLGVIPYVGHHQFVHGRIVGTEQALAPVAGKPHGGAAVFQAGVVLFQLVIEHDRALFRIEQHLGILDKIHAESHGGTALRLDAEGVSRRFHDGARVSGDDTGPAEAKIFPLKGNAHSDIGLHQTGAIAQIGAADLGDGPVAFEDKDTVCIGNRSLITARYGDMDRFETVL